MDDGDVMTTERITRTDVDAVCENLSRRIAPLTVRAQGRYGYIGLDVYAADGSMLRTLTTGCTKREAYEAAWIAIRAIDLLTEAKDVTR
jgi:hypothetical protein